MPTLSLSHHQRLNLFVLVGMPEVHSVLEAWPVWNLMDRLMLDDEEKQAIEFKTQLVDGTEAFSYNRSNTLAPREFEFSDAEIERIRKAVYSMNRIVPGMMRGWLAPLLAQLPEPVESDGNKP
jgi:hypothetical protein